MAPEIPNGRSPAPLHALSIGDILRHTRLADGDRLVDCLNAIIGSFRGSATIRTRHYSASIDTATCSFTRPHTTVFESSGRSYSATVSRWRRPRPARRRDCRSQALHRLTWVRAGASLACAGPLQRQRGLTDHDLPQCGAPFIATGAGSGDREPRMAANRVALPAAHQFRAHQADGRRLAVNSLETGVPGAAGPDIV